MLFTKDILKYDYKSSGVDIEKADDIIKNIKTKFRMENLENFAGFFNSEIFKDYTLVSSCDGIGSKVIPLINNYMPEIIACDLVAMNINDLITCGARPLFFLDYIAANNLNGNIIQDTIENLKLILNRYNCALLGGEISELPSLITENYFDIAGFIVGMYKKEDFLDKNNVSKNDIVVAFQSNGIHSNGFSLIRKLYTDKKISKDFFNSTLTPTKIYADIVYKLMQKKLIKSAFNITGGGIVENSKRAITKKLEIKFDFKALPKMEVFEVLKKYIEIEECYKVFNMGAGFAVICDKNDAQNVLQVAKSYNPFVIGEVI